MSLVIDSVWKGFAHKRAGAQWVLRDVSFTVEPGEFVSLIGHSGCGKSTLLNVVGGLTASDGGEVRLDDDVVTSPHPDRSMVFQDYSLLPRLSLEKVISAILLIGLVGVVLDRVFAYAAARFSYAETA